MKKLLLILSAVFVSTLTYSGVDDWNHPNPYAYDLKSEIIDNGATLKLTYSLNATAVHDQEKVYNDEIGLQIYLIDKNGERIKNADGTVWVNTKGAYTKGTHSVTIPVADLPPAAKEWLTSWEVVVHGNKRWTKPKLVYDNIKTDNPVYYPRAAHGIAVAKHPNNKYFGKVFTAEASTNTLDGNSVPNSVWEYDGQLKYQTYHHKDYLNDKASYFSATTNYEPHRIKISDDGRLFATCYHTTASDAILEYEGNGKWRTIVSCGEGWYKYYRPGTTTKESIVKLYRRIIGMDVKGSGSDLKIIAAWVTPRGSLDGNNYMAKVEVREYSVGLSGVNLSPESGTVVAEFNDYNTASGAMGLLYQGFRGGDANNDKQWNSATHGFVDVAYGKGTDNPIWMKVDFGANSIRPAKIMLFTNANKNVAYTYTMQASTTEGGSNGDGGCNNVGNGEYGYFGGSGIHIKGDTLFTASGGHKLFMYKIKNNTLTDKTVLVSSKQGLGTGGWVNAFAEDYAGNIYAISEDCDNIVVLATPYSGTRITRASAEQSFTVSDPIPNILATDLRYEPAGTKDAYKFSFKVNTKPSIAQIRFYKKANQSSMNSNIATIHADNYKKGQAGHETQNPDYVYTFPAEELKQGLMSVTFKMLGGDANSPTITDALPPGELCWSVYVEAPRQSAAIAPIYREEVAFNFNVDGKRKRKHIVVNNYPETDLFGTIIAANYENQTTTNSTTGVIHQERGLLFYGINDQRIDDSMTPPTENNSTNNRYTLLPIKYLNGATSDSSFLNYPRRMAVAPDGKIYIADEGATGLPSDTTFHNQAEIWTHQYGGIKIWDPAQPNKFSLFSHNKINTSTGVALWGETLYAVNTYPEFTTHSDGVADSKVSHYTTANQKGKYGWNGFVEYPLEKYVQGGTWNETDTIHRPLGQGDASGNFSIVAMEHGIWLCQHREHNVALKDAISQPLADNQEAICISFVPYNSNTRTWKSSWVNGKVGGSDVSKRSLFSQTTTAPVQSTPGGGMAYRKVKVSDTEYNEYIYVPNHDGNIAEVRITSWANPGTANARPVLDTANVKIIETPSAVKGDHDVTGTTKKWHAAAITSMNFDYAGNLVLTIGPGNHSSSHALMIYTMPYDRTNAQEIRAPESCIYIPERLHQIGMDNDDIQAILDEHHNSQSEGKCAIDLYRPLQGGMFNTLCLPFTVPMDHENNPLAGSEVRQFTGAKIEPIGGEKILCLEFAEVDTIRYNIPYIIKPQQNIKQIMRFNWPVTLAEDTTVNPMTSNDFDNGNTITYQGILPQTKVSVQYDEDRVTPLTLILVAENRLAELLPDAGQTTGTINGLRGYFQLAKKLSNGTILQITPKQSVSTSTTIIVDGKRVNIEKYLREGRVYIRMGDTLYTIDGQKVE